MFIAPHRYVARVFIHCSASDTVDSGKDLYNLVYKWHITERGWKDIGYHYLIDKEGAVIPCRGLEVAPAAQRNHNKHSIAICVHGLEEFTTASLLSLLQLCKEINKAYAGAVTFHGHCEVDKNKTCPVFDYKTVLSLDDHGFMR
jgi:N-acetyl-anhydromuramyl-L-alanine amidase AmpD